MCSSDLAALRAPRIRALLDAQGITPRGTSPQAFTEFMTAERARWRSLVARIAAAPAGRLTAAGEATMIESKGECT